LIVCNQHGKWCAHKTNHNGRLHNCDSYLDEIANLETHV
jgi:hypothetical protein